MSFGWLDNSSKSDLTVQHVLCCVGYLNEGSGVDRAFPEESL